MNLLMTLRFDFIKFIAKDIYPGIITQKVVDQFTPIVKKAFNQYLNDLINDRLKSALQKEESIQEVEETIAVPINSEIKIETTKEEYEAYHIIKSILRPVVPWKRVFMRDSQSYCAILLDDNNRKSICRLYFTNNRKQIAIIDASKKEQKFEIRNMDDIYNHSEELLAAVRNYLVNPIAE